MSTTDPISLLKEHGVARRVEHLTFFGSATSVNRIASIAIVERDALPSGRTPCARFWASSSSGPVRLASQPARKATFVTPRPSSRSSSSRTAEPFSSTKNWPLGLDDFGERFENPHARPLGAFVAEVSKALAYERGLQPANSRNAVLNAPRFS